MLVPWSNAPGAIVGAIAGFVMSGWVSFGGQYADASGLVAPHKLPISVEQCEHKYGIFVNSTEPVIIPS